MILIIDVIRKLEKKIPETPYKLQRGDQALSILLKQSLVPPYEFLRIFGNLFLRFSDDVNYENHDTFFNVV